MTFTGGEIRNPGRNLPRALVVGTTIVVTLYYSRTWHMLPPCRWQISSMRRRIVWERR